MAAGPAPAAQTGIGDLLTRLRAVTKGRDVIDVAQLHLVGLDKIERAYGGRWAEHKARIQEAAESFLKRRIGKEDVLVRGENGFLIMLDSAAGPEAHAVAAQLAHGLNGFFTGGEYGSPTPRVASSVQSMPARDIGKDLASIARSEPASAAEDAEAAGPANLDWKFEPVWDSRREVLSYSFVTPFNASTGLPVAGYRFEAGATGATQFAAIDEAGLWVAEQALLDISKAGRQALVGSCIHVRCLASLALRARLFATIDRLSPDLHRYRIIKIAGVSPGFPRMYLREIIGALRARVPNVVMLAAWDEPDLASMLHRDLTAVGIVAPGSGVLSGPIVATPALMARVNAGAKMAHNAQVRFFVEGAVTKYLALRLIQAGVDNIASQAIWPTRTAAESVERWPAHRLAA